MKTSKNIFIAFILNISFSIFEFIGGLLTNSIAIISDSIHDLGDAISIGISYFLERKSNKKPDNKYTYGYLRYSILGAFITTTILTIGSVLVIYSSINRLYNPIKVNYNGMIIFAIFGVIINFVAAYSTRDGDSINQKSVNLHMLEDVLGWVIVLIGSILMRFTNINIIDSIMSIGVSTFILINALKNFKEILDLFLLKLPENIDISEVEKAIKKIKQVSNIHHIHIWSIDGNRNYATMHIKTNAKDTKKLKHEIRDVLKEYNIIHVTIEIEEDNEVCKEENCIITESKDTHIHHHH